MFVGIAINAVIILERLPRLVCTWGKNAQTQEGVFPPFRLNIQCILIRLGMVLTVITAVLPDFARGRYHGSDDLTTLHLVGIGLGIALALAGIFWYNYTAVYCQHGQQHTGEFWKRPELWMPHVISVWTFWLTVTMVIGFGAANTRQPSYASYCES